MRSFGVEPIKPAFPNEVMTYLKNKNVPDENIASSLGSPENVSGFYDILVDSESGVLYFSFVKPPLAHR